ncbi:MAG: hypothetical protein P4L16_07100 [Chlamydiales bacterium]|nr:hypothetical protein [Chlamydiales bacterium]
MGTLNRLKLILICLLFSACSSQRQLWKHHEITTVESQYNSQRVYAYPEELFCGIEFEVIRDSYSVNSYLNVFIGSIPEVPNNSLFATVALRIDEQIYTFLARRFSGGQRLLLPSTYTQLIISSLLASKTCSFRLEGGYFGEFPPAGFAKEWARKPSFFSRPYLIKGA